MTYNVFSGTLNPTQSINRAIAPDVQCIWKHGVIAKVLWTFFVENW